MEKHPPAYLSASRLSCYEWCPAEFYKRYVLRRDEPPTPERIFGVSVHAGLEAYFGGLVHAGLEAEYRGQDGDSAFLKAWREGLKELAAADVVFGEGLDIRGLEILEAVRELGLRGEPERFVSVIYRGFKIPFIGYVDLWADGHIYDFKTTGYGWKQDKADAQIFQPAIYQQAYFDECGTWPKFTFVVMPRISGPAQLLDGTRTERQVVEAFERARQIHEDIEAQKWDCKCGKHSIDEDGRLEMLIQRTFERRKFVA
jgi:hypothetical protein